MAISSVVATPYCESLIALEYYDGPTTGVGWLPSKETIYFKLVGWDREQWQRLFLTIPIESTLVNDLQLLLEEYEIKKLPIWIPNARNDVPQTAPILATFRARLEETLKHAKTVSIVESRDLVHGVSRVASLSDTDSTLALSCARANRVSTLLTKHIFDDFLAQIRS
jgi:hypothetical protein